MRSIERKNRISALLSQFVTQVELSNAQNFTDINREAQNLLVRVLRTVYGLPKLRNLDLDQPNHPAIDLADDEAQIAFQVTSDPSTAKIRETLRAFTRNKLADRFSRVIIYVLTKKNSRYDADFSGDLPEGFNFSIVRDIVDYRNLLTHIQSLSVDEQNNVLAILEDEFGGRVRFQSAWTVRKFLSHASIYVEPKQFNEAEAILRKRGIVVLSGPPHIGKTETAYELLLRVDGDRGNGSVRYLKSVPNWGELFSVAGMKLLLDDPFGDTRFTNSVIADRFDDLLSLASHNYLVITSRQGVLSEATAKSRLGETSILKELTVELKQEGAYDDATLASILEKHIMLAAAPSQPDGVAVTAEQAKWMSDWAWLIVRELRFPHNIAHFVNHHAPTSSEQHIIWGSIQKAKDIVRAVKLWHEQQDKSMKALSAIAALFPGLSYADAETFVSDVFNRLELPRTNLASLVRRSFGYLRLDAKLDYEHPSYAEGVLLALQSDEIDFAWDIIRWRTETASNGRMYSLLQCRKALRLLRLDDWWRHGSKPSARDIGVHEFLEAYIKTYNKILGDDFAPIRSSFDPGWAEEACVVGNVEPDGRIVSYTPLRRLNGDPLVTLRLRPNTALFVFPDPILREMALRVKQRTVASYTTPDITRTIPEILAVERIADHIKKNIKNKDGVFLKASWHLCLARLFRRLKSAGFPVDTITEDNPLTIDQLESWAMPYLDPSGYVRPPQVKPFQIYRIDRHTQSINDLDVRLAIEDINTIEAAGRKITGPLLIQPDLSWDVVARNRSPVFMSNLYTDEHLREALLLGLTTYYEAYKQTAEMSSPSLCNRMPLYGGFPLKVTCVVDRTRPENSWADVGNYVKLSRLTDARPGELTRISVSIISENIKIEEREYASALLAEERYWNLSAILTTDEDGWISHVVDDIARDIEYVLNDPDCDIKYYPPSTT